MPRFLAELEAAVSEVERCLQELRLRNRVLEATGDLENRHVDELRTAYDRLNQITGRTPSRLDDEARGNVGEGAGPANRRASLC